MTQAEVNAYEARRRKSSERLEELEGCERESLLHEQIMAECRRRGWLVIHSRMDKRTTTGVGTPDFVIAGEETFLGGVKKPVVWFIEAKSRKGKLRPEQAAMIAQAARFGHTIHVVRSFEDFLTTIEAKSPLHQRGPE